MKILLLSPDRPDFVTFLKSFGDEVRTTYKRVRSDSEILKDIDIIVSYGCKHIIKKKLIDRFRNRIINLHISFLPYNRGADPNLWSFLEDTPKGVTIHLIDEGIDTGNILIQREVAMSPTDTLRTSYARLSESIEELFREVWPQIRAGRMKSTVQPSGGSYHYIRDREQYEHLLTKGWDTPVADLIGKALKLNETE